MKKVRAPGWRLWLLIAGLTLSLALTGIFVFRAFQHVPRSRSSESIRPWMNITYIAHAHRVPPAGLYQAIGLPPESPDKRPIVEIARSQDRPTGALIAELKHAIIQARASPSTADSPSLSIASTDSSLLLLTPSDSPALPALPTDSPPRPSSPLESSLLPSPVPDSSPHPPSPPAPPPRPATGENAP